ncbi:MAG: hypothetical protein ACRD82_14900 [Blastocatellia bacterium]
MPLVDRFDGALGFDTLVELRIAACGFWGWRVALALVMTSAAMSSKAHIAMRRARVNGRW